jgi:hypothetical protein
MKTYRVLVWHDYKATDTYEIEVQATSEEQAMERAVEEVKQGRGEWFSDRDRHDDTFEANENSVTIVE